MLTNKPSAHILPGSVSISFLLAIDKIDFGRLNSREVQNLLFEASVFAVRRALEEDAVSAEDSDAESFKMLGIVCHGVKSF